MGPTRFLRWVSVAQLQYGSSYGVIVVSEALRRWQISQILFGTELNTHYCLDSVLKRAGLCHGRHPSRNLLGQIAPH